LKLIESFSLHPFYLAKVGLKLPYRQFSSDVGGGVGEFSESALLDGSGLHQREMSAPWGKLAKLAGINFVKRKQRIASYVYMRMNKKTLFELYSTMACYSIARDQPFFCLPDKLRSIKS